MNKEIKEILEALEEVCCCPYHDNMCKKAKEHIINLHQRIHKALQLLYHNDILDYRVFEERLEKILKGEENE